MKWTEPFNEKGIFTRIRKSNITASTVLEMFFDLFARATKIDSNYCVKCICYCFAPYFTNVFTNCSVHTTFANVTALLYSKIIIGPTICYKTTWSRPRETNDLSTSQLLGMSVVNKKYTKRTNSTGLGYSRFYLVSCRDGANIEFFTREYVNDRPIL